MKRTRKVSQEWVQSTVRYHESLAAGFRRSAERALSGRYGEPRVARATELQRQAAQADRDAEYFSRLLRRR